jgi:hypothetical protein
MQQQKKAAVRKIASILAGIPLMTPSLREIVAALRLAAVKLRQRTRFEPDPRNRDAINRSTSSCTFLLTGRISSDSEGR